MLKGAEREVSDLMLTRYLIALNGDLKKQEIDFAMIRSKGDHERGIRPESLPAAEDVKKVERRLASEDKKSLKNPGALD